MDPNRVTGHLPLFHSFLPDVFVSSVLSGHSAATAAAAWALYRMPSLPCQATIDQLYDLIPSLCAAVRRASMVVDIFINLATARAVTHLLFSPHTMFLGVCVYVCVSCLYLYAHMSTGPALKLSSVGSVPAMRERWFSSWTCSTTETALLPHKYFRSSVFKV